MMKKVLAILLVICMLFASMVGCKKKDAADTTTGSTGATVGTEGTVGLDTQATTGSKATTPSGEE